MFQSRGISRHGQFAMPKRWEGKPRRDRWVFVASLIVFAISITIGVLSVGTLDNDLIPLTVLVFLTFSCTLVAYSLAIKPWRNGISDLPILKLPGPSTSVTILSYGRLPRITIYVLMLPVLIVFLFAPVIPEMGSEVTNPRAAWVPVVAPFMPIGAIYPAAVLVSVLFRKRKLLALGLSPTGIYHWTWFGCRYISWDWITAIEAFPHHSARIRIRINEPQEAPSNPEENWVSKLVRRPSYWIVAAYLDAHPALVYSAAHYYLRHPEKRAELGTNAALERMRRLDFPDIIGEIGRYGDVHPS